MNSKIIYLLILIQFAFHSVSAQGTLTLEHKKKHNKVLKLESGIEYTFKIKNRIYSSEILKHSDTSLTISVSTISYKDTIITRYRNISGTVKTETNSEKWPLYKNDTIDIKFNEITMIEKYRFKKHNAKIGFFGLLPLMPLFGLPSAISEGSVAELLAIEIVVVAIVFVPLAVVNSKRKFDTINTWTLKNKK